MQRRRVMLAARKQSRLPREYQEAEWIGSDITQYINTGIKPSEDLRTKIVQAFTGTAIAKNSSIFGSRADGDTRYWVNFDIRFEIGYGNWQATGSTTSVNMVNIIDFNFIKGEGHYSNFNGNEYLHLYDYSPNTTENIVLFGRNFNGSITVAPQKIYMTQFIRNNVLIGDFVPCYRKSDSKPGMYDLCGSICPLTNSPFYINAGTGEFLVGPNVN